VELVPITAASAAAKASVRTKRTAKTQSGQDRSGLRKFIIEAHFASRKSLM
jgi:hypothetical protein